MENGTHGRKWYTDEENNIAFSVLIEPNCEIEKLEGLTLEIAEIMIAVLKDCMEFLLLLNLQMT